MRRYCLLIACLLLLVACKPELPPSPPAPGEQLGIAGRAAGLPLSPSQLPRWASELKYTDISPVPVKHADTLKTLVVKPSGVTKDFYIYGIMYVWNKQFRIWEKLPVNAGQSGKIVKDWVKDKAVFLLPVTSDRFPEGANYLVVYTCIDTGNRDSAGKRIWDCNGNKWMLGAFMVGERWPNILIEEKIDDNNYLRSLHSVGGDGDVYEAEYQDNVGIKTIAQVTHLKNIVGFKKNLAGNYETLQKQWTKRGSVCGFLIAGTNAVQFSWLSGGTWISIKTLSSTVDDPKITKYGIKYPSDCNLLTELQGIHLQLPGACGNGKAEAPEQCDLNADSACPGGCKPDCTCTLVGDQNFGRCGDNILQKPNSKGENEECEPPERRDPVTAQLASASPCFTRDAVGKITGTGNCNDKCECLSGPLPPPDSPRCGDGKVTAGETCGDPGLPGCAAGQACINCDCVPNPLCGNGKQDVADEQCDPGNPGVACPAGKQCGQTCLCVKPPVCGNNKLEPPEQCEKHADCPLGINSVAICLACGCAYFPLNWIPAPLLVPTKCGDGVVQKPNFLGVMEECEKDADCANPPGGIVSPLCDKANCKCFRVCGDGRVDSPNQDIPPKNEFCDPPGAPLCPPVQLPDGGCAIGVCQNDCTCPPGPACLGCGDGFVDKAAGEECEKPGDWCGCAIGADGAVSCMVCSSTCKCGPTQGQSGCPKKDCPPVTGITMGVNTGYADQTGTFAVLGTRYPQYDHMPNSQCGDVCVQSVVTLGAVDTDGNDVTQDGACYHVTQATALGGVGPDGKPFPVVHSYTIEGVKAKCESGSIGTRINEPVVSERKCVPQIMNCPTDTECKDTATGAACVPKIAQPALPVCGDGIVNQASEQCEPPNTATCNANCQTISTVGNYFCTCTKPMAIGGTCFASSCSGPAAAATACAAFGLQCSCNLFSTGPVSSTGGAQYITGCP